MIQAVLERKAERVEEAVVLRILSADGAQTGVGAQEGTFGELLPERDARLPEQVERVGVDLVELPVLRRLQLKHVQKTELVEYRPLGQRAECRDNRRERGLELAGVLGHEGRLPRDEIAQDLRLRDLDALIARQRESRLRERAANRDANAHVTPI